MHQSIGLIEVSGLLPAITVADTMAKVANIQLVAIEKAKGFGWMTVKIEGNLDSVKAAIDAGEQTAMGINSFVSKKVIARPDESIFRVFVPKQEPEATVDKEDGIDSVGQAAEKEQNDVAIEADAVEKEHDEAKEDHADEKEHDGGQEDHVDTEKSEATCNLCQDPECPRKKGEPRTNCIHYKK